MPKFRLDQNFFPCNCCFFLSQFVPPICPASSPANQCAEVVRHRIAGVQMVVDVLSVTNEDKDAKREKTSAVRSV